MAKNSNLQVTAKSTPLADFSTSKLEWWLDHPKIGTHIGAVEKDIEIRGWVISKESESVSLVLKTANLVSQHKLNRMRPDVINQVLQESPIAHPQLICGFSVSVLLESFPVEIGFTVGSSVHWVTRIEFSPVQKVVAGLSGYLFLANDSNKSIDQYEGKELISDMAMAAWDRYFLELSSHKKENWAFLIAPSKEFIIPECYPYHRAPETPVDQILHRFQALHENVVHPIKELQINGHVTYSTGDTHWTDYGALIAAKAVCKQLKILNAFSGNLPRFNLV